MKHYLCTSKFMFTQAFYDLLKPQWLAALMELKTSGGLAISDLAKRLGVSYMTAKQHCEDLAKLGYLQRLRVPRTKIGRPEIFYRLSAKANDLFPGIPSDFTLGLLDQVRQMFGENTPDRLLFQYFQKQEESWKVQLGEPGNLRERAEFFAKIREKEGLAVRCVVDSETGEIILREFHHPLQEVLAEYPRAIALEQRAIEGALGARVDRRVVESLGGVPSYVDFVIKGS